MIGRRTRSFKAGDWCDTAMADSSRQLHGCQCLGETLKRRLMGARCGLGVISSGAPPRTANAENKR